MDATMFARELSERLSPSEMGLGIALANRNARRLLGDGIHLFEGERYPSATALAILAMEEGTKWWPLLQATMLHDPKTIHAAWRDYRSHHRKLDRAISIVMGAYVNSGGAPSTAATMDLARATQGTKERCIYSAFVTGRRWIDPSLVCRREECKNHLDVARIVLTNFRVTGHGLGAIFDQIAGRLAEPQEESAKQLMIAWSRSPEAISLAAQDDAESDAFRADAKRRLGGDESPTVPSEKSEPAAEGPPDA